jgi:hypothetical protein
MATAVRAPNTAGFSPKPNPSTKEASRKEARGRDRLRVRLPLHVRPFDARFIEIEDIGEVQNFTRDGLFFVTGMPHYLVGMRLIVTFPFGETVSAHHRYLASVVRLEDRRDGTRGIAVRFLA